jgi:hypothetical protein
MEILGTEGFLTNWEVYNTLTNLAEHQSIPSFDELLQKYKDLSPVIIHNMNKLKKELPFKKEHNAEELRQAEEKLNSAITEHSNLKSLESTIWIRSKVLSYLNNTCSPQQSETIVSSFLSKANDLCKKHRVEIMEQELLQLVNLRPTQKVEMTNIVEEYDERFSEEFCTELIQLIEQELPETNAAPATEIEAVVDDFEYGHELETEYSANVWKVNKREEDDEEQMLVDAAVGARDPADYDDVDDGGGENDD